MSHQALISLMRSRRGPEVGTLEEYFKEKGQEAWNRLNDVAHGNPSAVDDGVVEWAAARMAEAPGSFFYLLLNIAAKDENRREGMIARYRSLMPVHPGPALRCAGHNLHEYNFLLDDEWLAAADALFEHDPEGAWGIFEAAAMYRPKYVTPALVDAFEARRAAMPRDYFVSMLSLAGERPKLLERVLRAFPQHPVEAVDGTSFAARSEAPLLRPELLAAVLRHFDAAPEKAWEFFEGAVRARPEIFDAALLDALTDRAAYGPGTIHSILRHLMDAQPDGAAALMDRYVAMVLRHPEKGIHSVRYAFQREDIRLVRPDLVRAVCKGFPHDAYAAYEFLWHCAEDRPELIGPPEVEAALKNIGHATNRAFGFFRQLIKLRPEFTRECTLALFESLAQEPVNRAHVRAEEMEGLIAISEAAHIRTGLENALREPPRVGSRRARALMAIMFRQKLRARRHVLLEALRYAATVVLWRKEPAEKYSPIWDFVMFIIDNSADDAVSTAAAERFLEGAFQLHYLCRTGAEHEEFLRRLDTGAPAERPFPAGAEFLKADADLAHLYHLVLELGQRFSTEPRITPLAEFRGRLEKAQGELRVLDGEVSRADGWRRKRLEERRLSLGRQVACWRDPEYLRAFLDADAESRLTEEARAFLRREKKDLAKQLRDALRAEAIRIAVAAVDRSRLNLYGNRLRDALGRDVDIAEVEPKILPAFLWFQAIGGMRNNTKYLRRLIEDRISKRPHDWLRSEPPALEWAERVTKGQPGVRLDRWRAPFSRELQYRPKDALAEKRRRIKADLSQARALLERAGAKGIASESYEDLAAKLEELKKPPAPVREGEERPASAEAPAGRPAPAPDPSVLAEIGMNLERVRISEQTPDSDFEGRILLTVETDPFEILFMGEYGFASCLSLRGSNAWSAVSNAIDIDKAIVWAKEPGGNVVGRRLLALTPGGILVYRTYTNRHGLALDRVFDEFVDEYAAHCGAKVARGGRALPLLSDRWYDDGAMA
jgi:hypothetical protein